MTEERENYTEEESKEHELNDSQYDLESEDIIEWAPHEDNKIQIKYYDAAQNTENNPINFYQNIAKNYSEISEQTLKFNKLSLVESSFTEAQWNQLKQMIKTQFSKTIKRVRMWDCGLSLASDAPQEVLDQDKSVTFSYCFC